jgi:hypothetical protein
VKTDSVADGFDILVTVSPDLQKIKQMAGFSARLVDLPEGAGFTQPGPWGALSQKQVGALAPDERVRRVRAMTRSPAVVCADTSLSPP